MRVSSSVLVMSLLTLAGCQTQDVDQLSYTQQKAWAAGIVQSCKDQKVPEAEMQACVETEAKRDAANRYYNRQRAERARLAIAAGLEGASSGMQANAASTPRPVNCTSTLGGTFVGRPDRINTTCY